MRESFEWKLFIEKKNIVIYWKKKKDIVSFYIMCNCFNMIFFRKFLKWNVNIYVSSKEIFLVIIWYNEF